MKKKTWLILAFFLIVGGVWFGVITPILSAGAGVPVSPVSANDSNLVLSTPVISEPKVEYPSSNTVTSNSNSQFGKELEFKPVAQDSDVQEVLQSLHELSLSQLPTGWLHRYTRTIFSTDFDHGMSESGVDLTDEEVWDIWSLLDDQGYVQREISIQYNGNGEIVQVAVVGDGSGWNSGSGEISNSWVPFFYDPEANLISDYEIKREYGIAPTISEVDLTDGTHCLRIVYEVIYSPSLEFAQMKSVTRIISRVWVDEKTGRTIAGELEYVFIDGTRQVVSRSETKYTFEDPSEEILKWFAEKEARIQESEK